MKYIVIATVGGIDYLSSVEADSLCGAEHVVLDKAVCGMYGFGYGVDGCCAYDFEAMETETFRSRAFASKIVSFEELEMIIERRNETISKKVEAYELIEKNERMIKVLNEQIEVARKILEV